MKDVISWIDRECARLEMFIEGSKRGAFFAVIQRITAKRLARKDPAPEALRAALEIASREQIT